MARPKGHPKSGGRKKGTPNENTQKARDFVAWIMKKGYDDVDELWDELKAKEKMDAIVKLMDHLIPKQARVENTNKLPSNVTINFLPASQERLAEQNTIDIEHEDID